MQQDGRDRQSTPDADRPDSEQRAEREEEARLVEHLRHGAKLGAEVVRFERNPLQRRQPLMHESPLGAEVEGIPEHDHQHTRPARNAQVSTAASSPPPEANDRGDCWSPAPGRSHRASETPITPPQPAIRTSVVEVTRE